MSRAGALGHRPLEKGRSAQTSTSRNNGRAKTSRCFGGKPRESSRKPNDSARRLPARSVQGDVVGTPFPGHRAACQALGDRPHFPDGGARCFLGRAEHPRWRSAGSVQRDERRQTASKVLRRASPRTGTFGRRGRAALTISTMNRCCGPPGSSTRSSTYDGRRPGSTAARGRAQLETAGARGAARVERQDKRFSGATVRAA